MNFIVGCLSAGILAVLAHSLFLCPRGIVLFIIPLWRLGWVSIRLCLGSLLLLAQNGQARPSYCPHC